MQFGIIIFSLSKRDLIYALYVDPSIGTTQFSSHGHTYFQTELFKPVGKTNCQYPIRNFRE
jgi:hypothetical protein